MTHLPNRQNAATTYGTRIMTTNEWLRQLHEGNPGMFRVEFLNQDIGKWMMITAPAWYDDYLYRLIPITPEGVKEAPEEAYIYGPGKGGVFVGQGHLLKRGMQLTGWSFYPLRESDSWDHSEGRLKHWLPTNSEVFFIADLSAPDHREAVARFLPDFRWPDEAPELPEGIPEPPDGWVYAGMGDAMEGGEQCLYFEPRLRTWELTKCSQTKHLHYARRITPNECCDELTKEAQEQGLYDQPTRLVTCITVEPEQSIEIRSENGKTVIEIGVER